MPASQEIHKYLDDCADAGVYGNLMLTFDSGEVTTVSQRFELHASDLKEAFDSKKKILIVRSKPR